MSLTFHGVHTCLQALGAKQKHTSSKDRGPPGPSSHAPASPDTDSSCSNYSSDPDQSAGAAKDDAQAPKAGAGTRTQKDGDKQHEDLGAGETEVPSSYPLIDRGITSTLDRGAFGSSSVLPASAGPEGLLGYVPAWGGGQSAWKQDSGECV